MSEAQRDQNHVPSALGVSSTSSTTTLPFKIDSTTGRLLIDLAGGSGTVTDVSVVTANGFAGTVANSTTTPAITLSTTINSPVLKGNGTAISAATTTGSGSTVVLNNTPTLITPVLGAATATSINGLTITTSTGTLTITNGKVVTVTGTLTFGGTDGSTVAFGAGGTVLYTTSTIPLTVGATTIASGTSTRILYDNAGVLGEYTISGSGTVVAMQTSPSLLTSLLMDSGFVMNWASSNVVLTHSSGILTLGTGDLRVTTAGSNTASVVTVGGTQTLTAKTLTSPTLQTTPTIADGANIILTVPTVDGTATGEITNAFNSGYSSSAVGDLVILDSSATWQKTDANTASIYNGLIGIALEVKASGAALKVLLRGFAYMATAFPTFTIGGAVYMSETAGAVTQTAPTTTDAATRLLGYAVHADKMWFNPSNDWITHT